jgi:hypothetical protein
MSAGVIINMCNGAGGNESENSNIILASMSKMASGENGCGNQPKWRNGYQ